MLDACTGARQRLTIVLARYGAMRVPSECVNLKWSDIDWEKKRIKIYPVKTAKRYVPLFPEIAETLTELWDELQRDKKDPDAVIEDRIYHDWTDKKSLGKFWADTAKRAGIIIWARPADNMRSTRENELKHVCTVDVLGYIMGHSPETATKHYLRVSEDDFQRLAGLRTDEKRGAVFSGQSEVILKKPVSKGKNHGAESGAECYEMALNSVETGNSHGAVEPAVSPCISTACNENTRKSVFAGTDFFRKIDPDGNRTLRRRPLVL